jgi:hypothetical protein
VNENWKAVDGYVGLYEVSDLGRVRRVPRSRAYPAGRVLRPWMSSTGYPCVTLYRQGIGQKFKVHRLVALAFVAGSGPGLEVCHNDGDRLNAAASNLRWGTRSDNMRDAVRHGTQFNHFRDRTHCANGHPFDDANTLVTSEGRSCRTCRRDRVRAWRLRHRAELA